LNSERQSAKEDLELISKENARLKRYDMLNIYEHFTIIVKRYDMFNIYEHFTIIVKRYDMFNIYEYFTIIDHLYDKKIKK
jgi:hypothetical protein